MGQVRQQFQLGVARVWLCGITYTPAAILLLRRGLVYGWHYMPVQYGQSMDTLWARHGYGMASVVRCFIPPVACPYGTDEVLVYVLLRLSYTCAHFRKGVHDVE